MNCQIQCINLTINFYYYDKVFLHRAHAWYYNQELHVVTLEQQNYEEMTLQQQ